MIEAILFIVFFIFLKKYLTHILNNPDPDDDEDVPYFLDE